MDDRIIAILGGKRSARIAHARTLSQAMDATDLVEHYTCRSQSLFWVPARGGRLSLAVIEKMAAGRGWTVWMQPLALGLSKEREWKFGDRTTAVAWMACAVVVGIKKADKARE